MLLPNHRSYLWMNTIFKSFEHQIKGNDSFEYLFDQTFVFNYRQNGQTPGEKMAKDDGRIARKRYITAGPRRKSNRFESPNEISP